MELTLGLSEADLAHSEAASFAQLGGDSLAAIQFARAIDDLCGVPLPVSFVLDHSNSLAAITAKARAGCMGAAGLCWRLTDSPDEHARLTLSQLTVVDIETAQGARQDGTCNYKAQTHSQRNTCIS